MQQLQHWKVRDYFSVELKDGSYALGQVLDIGIPNTASCALFDSRFPKLAVDGGVERVRGDVISAVALIPAHLDRGLWRVVAHGPPAIPKAQWPNESTRENGWVGSKVYTGAIVEEFLNAFFGLAPWDDFAEPQYLDRLLISLEKKPKNVLLIRK